MGIDIFDNGLPIAGNEWDLLTNTDEQTDALDYLDKHQDEPPKPADYQRHKLENAPGDKWGKKAEDGYEVDPDELRSLSTTVYNELETLKLELNKVTQLKAGYKAEDLGGGNVGEQWVTMANTAKGAFTEYLNNVTTIMGQVAEALKQTADNYDNQHKKTDDEVNNVDVT